MKVFGSLVLAGMLGFFPGISTAQVVQVTLAWEDSTSPNLGGYTLHYGRSSRNYSTSVDVGNQTRYTLTDLEAGTTYYFAVSAYDLTQTVRSDFSNEVSYPALNNPPEAYLESPAQGSFESGISLIRGWVCQAGTVEVQIDGGARRRVAYGTARGDTRCPKTAFA